MNKYTIHPSSFEKINSDAESLKIRSEINSNNTQYNLDDWIFEKTNPSSGMRILDLGCGNGKQILYFSKRVKNSEFVGIDISREAIENVNNLENSESQNRIIGHCQSFNSVSNFLKDQMFDLILSTYAIYYSDNQVNLISSLKKNLKPGCFAFICGPGLGTNKEFYEIVNREILDDSSDKLSGRGDFIKKSEIKILEKNFKKVELLRLGNKVIFKSSDEIINWWQNHISYLSDSRNKVYSLFNDFFDNTKFFHLTKNVLSLKIYNSN